MRFSFVLLTGAALWGCLAITAAAAGGRPPTPHADSGAEGDTVAARAADPAASALKRGEVPTPVSGRDVVITAPPVEATPETPAVSGEAGREAGADGVGTGGTEGTDGSEAGEPAQDRTTDTGSGPETLFRLELVQTVPAGVSLEKDVLLGLIGADGYTPAQRKAVLGQIHVFATPACVVILPAHIDRGQTRLGLPLQIYNRTRSFLHVHWDESLYLDHRGNHRLAPRGLRVTHPRNEPPRDTNTSIHPTRIPPGLFFKGYVFPVKDFDFKTGAIRYTPTAGQIGLFLSLHPQGDEPLGISLLLRSRPAEHGAAPPSPAAGTM